MRVLGMDNTLYVVEGTDLKDLRKGPGHMQGTALPGGRGICLIAGHRDTHFLFLQHVRAGDKVELTTGYGTFLYKVRSIGVVPPTDQASFRATNEALLRLITCYPFYFVGPAPNRLAIEAVLESPAKPFPAPLASIPGQ